MFDVYVIRNGKDNIYVGYTDDLLKRIKRHNGVLKNKSTSFTFKNSGPWTVIYKETVPTRKEAIKREKQLKSYQGRQFIRATFVKNIKGR